MKKLTILVFTFLGFSCNNLQYNLDDFTPVYGSRTDSVDEYFNLISEAKIYFGHQSVGKNILRGIESWKKETGSANEIIESRNFVNLPEAGFIHFTIGQNGDPIGKVDDFVSLVAQIPPDERTLAFFKFCYADFVSGTDVENVYAYFKKNMLELKNNYPDISFIACTVPYTGVQEGIRALAKRMLGRAPHGSLENIKRKEFNDLVLNDLAQEIPIFDLAATESTSPDGSIETFRYKREEYPCLPIYFRSDFGHLNDNGARIVAFNLLAFLAQEFEKSNSVD